MVAKHLKNRKMNTPISINDFIEGGESLKESKEAVPKPVEQDILLSFSGRIDREKECDKKGFLLYLKKDSAYDIDKYCHGSKQGILNYLIRRGLDELIKDNKVKLIME